MKKTYIKPNIVVETKYVLNLCLTTNSKDKDDDDYDDMGEF